MKLLELYSLASGLKIGKQYLVESFYPLPFTRYITLQSSSGMPGKNYSFFPLVVELIKPYLDANNIHIVQLGGKDDVLIASCHSTLTNSSVGQASYLLRNALLHLGSDSVFGHRAGYLDIPMVQLWGPTDPANHSSYEADPAKTVHLVSHRWGRNPSFAAQEQPKSIDLICPFDVARATLDLLKIQHTITQRTINMGGGYNQLVLEWIPNVVVNPAFNPDLPLAVRYDMAPNEQMLAQVLQLGRKVNIVTKSEINLNLLNATKGQILTYNHEVDETISLDYVKAVRKIRPDAIFFTRSADEAKVASIRFHLFDIVQVQQVRDKTRDDFVKAAREYLNDPTFSLDIGDKFPRLEFRTNKYVLSNGKMYLSLAHERAGLDKESPQGNVVLDDEWYWHDQNQMMVYTT